MDFLARGQIVLPIGRSLPELYQAGALDGLGEQLPVVAGRSPILQTLLTGDKQPMIDALRGDISWMQRFNYMMTGAEQFTDRIFLEQLVNATVCYTGGYATRNKDEQRPACSWEGLGTDFAALVLTGRKDHFKAIVYNFSDQPLTGSHAHLAA